MTFAKGYDDLTYPATSSNFAKHLGLSHLGICIYVLNRVEGFDCFHNHREQKEGYFCLDQNTNLIIREQSHQGAIAALLSIAGKGDTGFSLPQDTTLQNSIIEGTGC